MNLFKKKKLPLIEKRKEIKEGKNLFYINIFKIEIQNLFSYKTGLYIKLKEYETKININILIDKRIIGIDETEKKSQIPDIIIFLLFLSQNYPEEPPKLMTKSNFIVPSLMDGRDLFFEVCPNWSPKTKLIEIISGIIPFCAKVINNKTYQFYGTFHIESIYNLKVFENMIVNSFKCKLSPDFLDKSLNINADYIIILSGDSFLLFDDIGNNEAKIVFWCNILSITDLQIKKSTKIASINFFEDIENKDYKLKLIIDNIIIFRDTLVSRMNSLEIKVVSKMVDPLKKLKRRITLKDMSRMKLNDIEESAKELKQKIEKGEVDNYTINTFTTLCGKAIEELNRNNDELKQFEFMNMMKNVLQMEKVNELTEKEEKETKNNKMEISKNKNNNICSQNILNDSKEGEKDNEEFEEKNIGEK